MPNGGKQCRHPIDLLFNFPGQLKDAQVRDVSDIHPGFQNGLRFATLPEVTRYPVEI